MWFLLSPNVDVELGVGNTCEGLDFSESNISGPYAPF